MRLLLILVWLSQILGQASDCNPNSFFRIHELTLSPNPPIPNQNASLSIYYEAPFEVADGTSDFACTLNGIPVISSSHPLCEGMPCPITTGLHNLTNSIEIPEAKGSIVCRNRWTSSANEQLLCVQIKMTQSLFNWW